MLAVATLICCVSVLGRALFGRSLLGDVEMMQVALTIAVAAFMPYAQLARAHISVDFFTQKLTTHQQRALDSIGALFVAATFALLAWRTGVAGWRLLMLEHSPTTMLLGFPEWVIYALTAPCLALAALSGGWVALADWRCRHGTQAASWS